MAANLSPPYDRILSLHLDSLIIARDLRQAWPRWPGYPTAVRDG